MLVLGLVGGPGGGAQLIPLTLALLVKLEFVRGIAASRKLGEEFIIVARLGRFGYDDFGIVEREAVDDVVELLTQLERLGRLQALGVNFNFRGRSDRQAGCDHSDSKRQPFSYHSMC